MTDKVREQILKIRDSGRENMFNIRAVQRLAFEAEYFELVTYIEDHPREYVKFILTGRKE